MSSHIETAENAFLSSGMERMSKYFGKSGKRPDGTPYQNVLWDKKGRYYHLVEDGRFIAVECGENLDGTMETILSFSKDLNEEELANIVIEARGYTLNKYSKVLESYRVTPLKEPKIYLIPDRYFENGSEGTDRNGYGIGVIYYEKKYEPPKVADTNGKTEVHDGRLAEVDALFDQKDFYGAIDRCKMILTSLGQDDTAIKYYCFSYIAYIYRLIGDYANAFFTDSESYRNLLADRPGASSVSCYLLRNLAYDSYLLGDYTEAERYAWAFMNSVDSVYGVDSEEMQESVLFSEPILYLNGKRKDAYKMVLSVYAKAKGMYGLTNEITLEALSRIPSYYLLVRAYDKAIEIDAFVYNVYLSLYGEDDVRTLNALVLLSIDLGIAGKRSDAVAISEYCASKTQDLFGYESPEHLIAEYDCGLQYLAWNRWGKARAIFKNCLPAVDKLSIENSKLKYQLLNGIADANFKSGRTGDAYEIYKNIYEELSVVLDEYDIRVIEALEKTARPLWKSKPEEAAEILKQVYRKKCLAVGDDSDETLTTLSNLSVLCSDLGDYEESLKLNLECYKKYSSKYGNLHDGTINCENNLVICYKDLKRYEEAYQLAQTIYLRRKDLIGEDDPETLRMKQYMDDLQKMMKKEPAKNQS